MLPSMAAKERTFRLTAWLAPILFLLVAVAAAQPALALTCGALETRAWEKTSFPLESRLVESSQLLNLHQQNEPAGYDDALGSPLAAESAETTYVIGRQADTAAYAGKAGYTQLNDPAWTLAKNDAWIQSAIDSNSPVLLASEPTVNTFFDFTSKYFGTVTAREVDQLMNAGYQFVIQDLKQLLLPP
jgi:hypothetical protein